MNICYLKKESWFIYRRLRKTSSFSQFMMPSAFYKKNKMQYSKMFQYLWPYCNHCHLHWFQWFYFWGEVIFINAAIQARRAINLISAHKQKVSRLRTSLLQQFIVSESVFFLFSLNLVSYSNVHLHTYKMK